MPSDTFPSFLFHVKKCQAARAYFSCFYFFYNKSCCKDYESKSLSLKLLQTLMTRCDIIRVLHLLDQWTGIFWHRMRAAWSRYTVLKRLINFSLIIANVAKWYRTFLISLTLLYTSVTTIIRYPVYRHNLLNINIKK